MLSRFLFFCLLGPLGIGLTHANDATTAPQTGKKDNAAGAPDSAITFNWIHVDGPYVALTFDDGPSAKLTPRLLDLLAARHIKATFFLIGENAADYREIVAREAREGHEIANHSWSHPTLAKMSDDGVRSQLRRTEDAIRSSIGTAPTLLRPPYGSISARQK